MHVKECCFAWCASYRAVELCEKIHLQSILFLFSNSTWNFFLSVAFSFPSRGLLTFNWVCVSVIIKWKGNEVSVSLMCHRYSVAKKRRPAFLTLPCGRRTMAITTQLTLSIYTAVWGEEHTATCTVHSEEWKDPPTPPPRLPIDPVILTATPVVRPVILDKKRSLPKLGCFVPISCLTLSSPPASLVLWS